MDKLTRIRELNDQLRTMAKGGRIQMTPDVYELDPQLRGRALSYLTRYNKFDADSEHDYGVFIFAGYSFVWAIGYRGPDGNGLSKDPADPDKTFRVLTLSLTSDVLNGVPSCSGTTNASSCATTALTATGAGSNTPTTRKSLPSAKASSAKA